MVGYFGLILDISEQHRAEKALRDSDERYRAFIEQSSEGIWRFELEQAIPIHLPTDEKIRLAYEYGYLAECNDAMARQYGLSSAAEITGARLGDLLVESDPRNYEFLKAFMESGYRIIDAESHEHDIEGRDRYFLNNFVGYIEDGKLVRAWGSQRDVSHRKEIERATARLASIVESSDDAIISKDLGGIITSWNKSAEKVFGYSAEEAIGRPVSILIPAHMVNEGSGILERIGRGESIQNYETVRRKKDGAEIFISLTVSPIRDADQKIIGASKIARDITASKRAEETLLENQVMLSMAMQSSRMGAWEQENATEIVHWSEELEEIFGLEPGTFPGTRSAFYDLIYEEDRQETWAEVETAIDEHRELQHRISLSSCRWQHPLDGRPRAGRLFG